MVSVQVWNFFSGYYCHFLFLKHRYCIFISSNPQTKLKAPISHMFMFTFGSPSYGLIASSRSEGTRTSMSQSERTRIHLRLRHELVSEKSASDDALHI